jgi:hypothetical protein
VRDRAACRQSTAVDPGGAASALCIKRLRRPGICGAVTARRSQPVRPAGRCAGTRAIALSSDDVDRQARAASAGRHRDGTVSSGSGAAVWIAATMAPLRGPAAAAAAIGGRGRRAVDDDFRRAYAVTA